MDIRRLGGSYYSVVEMRWSEIAKGETASLEEHLSRSSKIGQHRKLLIFTDGEDRQMILAKHDDWVRRNREALKRAGIPFVQNSSQKYEKEFRSVRKGFDREDILTTWFDYTVTPDKQEQYLREACKESREEAMIAAYENDAYEAMSHSSSAREIASEAASKACGIIREAKERFPSLCKYRINCSVDLRELGIGHENEGFWDLKVNFEHRGLKKPSNPQQRALCDVAAFEIFRQLTALPEVDCVFWTPTYPDEEGDSCISNLSVLYVLDEKNRKGALKDW